MLAFRDINIYQIANYIFYIHLHILGLLTITHTKPSQKYFSISQGVSKYNYTFLLLLLLPVFLLSPLFDLISAVISIFSFFSVNMFAIYLLMLKWKTL